jgi:hypothetical protein
MVARTPKKLLSHMVVSTGPADKQGDRHEVSKLTIYPKAPAQHATGGGVAGDA